MRAILFHPFLLSAVLLSAAPSSHAQPVASPNALDSNGCRQGRWTVLFDSAWCEVPDLMTARFFRVVTYRAGSPVGMTRDYYLPGGALQWIGRLHSENPDRSDGCVVYFHENGRVSSEGWKEDGRLEGPWTFYNEDGGITDIGSFVHGVREGLWAEATEGCIAVGAYVHGLRQGPWRFDLEKQRTECDLRDGVAQGVAITRYDDGSCVEKRYVDGRIEGETERFAANGMRVARGGLRGDTRVGLWEFFSDSGALLCAEWYGSGSGSGSSISWNADGSLLALGGLLDGLMSGPWLFLHSNGMRSSEGAYASGEPEGFWRAWNENGRIRSEGTYRKGKRVGAWTDWKSDGARHERVYNDESVIVSDIAFDAHGNAKAGDVRTAASADP
jgi:antitoxin component YwqK of YwqJK toxin-antitoxin module